MHCVCVCWEPLVQTEYLRFILPEAGLWWFGVFFSPLAAAGRLAHINIHSQINDKALFVLMVYESTFSCCLH